MRDIFEKEENNIVAASFEDGTETSFRNQE